MTLAEHLVIIAVALTMSVSWSIWLGIILLMPRRWSKFVDWENAQWVRTGLLPEKWATKLTVMEKGAVLKVILVLGIAASMAILFKA